MADLYVRVFFFSVVIASSIMFFVGFSSFRKSLCILFSILVFSSCAFLTVFIIFCTIWFSIPSKGDILHLDGSHIIILEKKIDFRKGVYIIAQENEGDSLKVFSCHELLDLIWQIKRNKEEENKKNMHHEIIQQYLKKSR